MRHGWIFVMAVAVLAATLAPTGGARGVFGDPDCEDGVGCAPATLCIEGYYCQADACDPATRCDARTWLEHECAYNETHQGETCSHRARTSVEAGGRSTTVPGAHAVPGSPFDGASVRVPHNEIVIGSEWSRGSFFGDGVSNDWMSNIVSVRLELLDFDLGQTSVAVYESTIRSPENETDEEHLFVWGVATVHHDGPFSSAGGSVGALLMDGQPEHCYLRVGPRSTSELTCDDVETLI